MRKIDILFFKRHRMVTAVFMLMFLYLAASFSCAEAASGFDKTTFTFAGAPATKNDMEIFNILQKVGNGLIDSARNISGIMIAVTGMMWVFGANRNISANLLRLAIGASLVSNIAWFVNSGYFFNISGFLGTAPAYPSVKEITVDLNGSWNFMGIFMVYFERVIIYASYMIMPYAIKLLGFLTVLEMVSVLMFRQSGDHIQYLVHSVIKTGFFIFLIANWINGSTSIANSVFTFFEEMGIIATDFPGQVSAIGLGDTNSSTALVAENIMGNTAIIAKNAFGIGDAADSSGIMDTVSVIANPSTNIASSLANAAVSLVTIFVLIMTAGCLVVTRIEFWIMALMALLLIPFGANQYTRFLFERVIGGVFNLGIKMCVISFICYCSTPILTKMVEQMTNDNSSKENIILLIACLSGCYTIMMLASKAPALVSGLLNGSPQMTRGDLLTPTRQVYGGMSSAGNTAIGAAKAYGNIRGTVAAANNQAGGYNAVTAEGGTRYQGFKGTMANLKEYGKTQLPHRRAWSAAQDDYESALNKKAKLEERANQAKKTEIDENGNKVSQAWKPTNTQTEIAAQAEQKAQGNVVQEDTANEVNKSNVSNITQQTTTKENISSSETINKTENTVKEVTENKTDNTGKSEK